MLLNEYLKELPHGEKKKMAMKLGVSCSSVTNWVQGRRPNPLLAPKIEELTNGMVSTESMMKEKDYALFKAATASSP